MKITDGKKTVNLEIVRWNGSGYDPDMTAEYLIGGGYEYDEELEAIIVSDVDREVEFACSFDECGPRIKSDIEGNMMPDDDVIIFVDGERVS